MKNAKVKFSAVISILLITILALSACGVSRADASSLSDGTAAYASGTEDAPVLTMVDVVRVVDGDTIVVSIDGKDEKVRFIGVDTPESVHPDESRNTPFGKVVSEYTKDKLSDKKVGLEFDVQERDKYGRLLAYVYLKDVMFNNTLVKKGYASVATFPPNVKYVELFTKSQESARKAKKGMWSDKWSKKQNDQKKASTKGNKYVGSTNSNKFHYLSCRYVKTIKAKNKIYFSSRSKATKAGYVPCKVCKP